VHNKLILKPGQILTLEHGMQHLRSLKVSAVGFLCFVFFVLWLQHGSMAVPWHPGWDQQMSYTWASDRWVMPAPYYTTSVVYADLGFSQPTFVLSCWVKKDALWVGTIVTLSIYPSIHLSIYLYIYTQYIIFDMG